MDNIADITVCVTACKKTRILNIREGRVALLTSAILADKILSPLVTLQAFELKLNNKRFGRLCDLDEDDLIDDGAEIICHFV